MLNRQQDCWIINTLLEFRAITEYKLYAFVISEHIYGEFNILRRLYTKVDWSYGE